MLQNAQRLVVKIGSALLVDKSSGKLRTEWLQALCADLARWHATGRDIVVVTSGAIALGRHTMGLPNGSLQLAEKQAAAAIGQIQLAHAYEAALRSHGIAVAQVLLTMDDTEQRHRHLNARATLGTLLQYRMLPVINENDTIATSEIKFGDNDRLAARVAQMLSADTLILLSDIDGLYTQDPRKNPEAKHLEIVRKISPEIEAMAGKPPPGYSSGGMITKIDAARIAMQAGCRMVITNGHVLHPLQALEDGARCTWFLPRVEPQSARKKWIRSGLKTKGKLWLDAGAAQALVSGKSLLPAGVVRLEGSFRRGDLLSLLGPDGRELGRGLAAYPADEAEKILGHKSADFEAILGYRGPDELVHRDDMAL